ncbi:hypothetical protein DFH11DRAFT_1543891 [Phellopilus nigrolimitatus]|nr:hypothetical protein DFH11DRAFT_1543891 [Phellopilus nigrolimitatus]
MAHERGVRGDEVHDALAREGLLAEAALDVVEDLCMGGVRGVERVAQREVRGAEAVAEVLREGPAGVRVRRLLHGVPRARAVGAPEEGVRGEAEEEGRFLHDLHDGVLDGRDARGGGGQRVEVERDDGDAVRELLDVLGEARKRRGKKILIMLLLVVSETGLLYTFTIAKLQPLVKQLEGKNLIQACLNVPHRPLPSNMPVGAPLDFSAPRPNQPQMASMQATGGTRNFPGLSISGTPPGGPGQEDDAGGDHGDNVETEGEKRSSAAQPRRAPHQPQKLAEDFVRWMLVLWPLAATRMNLDALSECFGSVLAYMSSDLAFPNGFASVCVLVVRSFRQSIGNSSNRKKQRDEKSLKSEVLQTGIEVLFPVESLKGSADPLETLLTDYFTPSIFQKAQLRVLPQLYKVYVQETRKHRFAIFGSGSSQSQEQTVQNKVRDTGMSAFTSCYKTLRVYGDELEVWQSVLSLLEVLEEANLVGFGLSESANVLNDIVTWAVNALSTSTAFPKKSEAALKIICVLTHIDLEIISPLTGEILSDIITMNPSDLPASQSLLHELLDFHSKTRTIPVFLAVLIDCLSNSSGSLAATFLSLAHLEGLSRAIKGFLTPGQTPETVQAVLEALEAVWITYADSSGSDDTMDVDEDANDRASNTKSANGRKQKRRKTDEPAVPMSPKERAALSYSFVARAVAVILPSLPFSTLPESSYATVCSSISEAWEKFLGNAAQSAFSEKTNAPCWTDQIVTAATLRIRHAFATCSSLRSLNTLDARMIPCGMTAGLIRFAETTPELIVELLRSFFDENLRVTDPEEQDAIIKAMLAYLYTNLA